MTVGIRLEPAIVRRPERRVAVSPAGHPRYREPAPRGLGIAGSRRMTGTDWRAAFPYLPDSGSLPG